MYQITISVDYNRADWLYSVDDVIKNKLQSCFAVSALRTSGRRLYCSFGCEAQSREKMLDAIKSGLIETFGVVGKYDFIKSNLSLGLSKTNYDLLLHTLVAFDRENEYKLLDKIINVEDNMTLDGIFNFKLYELKERWIEICNLTRSNGAYLYDDETYIELLRFLISAVNPKVNKLTVREVNGSYSLSGSLKNSVINIAAKTSAELMYYLIDLAPLELIIDGGLSNSELSKRLIGIFDAKTLDTVKNKTKK
ncbi:MAG: hypothetical protein J1F69_02630 [Clostridiales bacterium]|nr:hypothetical protein [Clostridiales bacterium]